MHIEHLAGWCRDPEKMKNFYIKYFHAVPGNKYHNPGKQFSSYFIGFENGPQLEPMEIQGIPDSKDNIMEQFTGLIHFAFAVGSKKKQML